MTSRMTATDIYRNLGIALGASLLILVLAPKPGLTRTGILLSKAAQAAAAGEPASALEAVRRAREFEPALAALDTTAAWLALQSGDAAQARALLGEARTRAADPDSLACLEFDLGLASANPGQASNPPPSCQAGLIDLEAWLAASLARGDLAAAKGALETSIDSRPGDLRAWEALTTLTALTAPEAVEAVAMRALRVFPQGSPVLDGLLSLARRESSSGLTPAVSAARAGELLAAQGDWPLAAAAWRRAVELDPNFPQARAFLGLATSMTGGQGLAELQRAAAEAPRDPIVRSLLGQYWLAQGDAVHAERELAFARTLDSENPAIEAAYGSALEMAGKYPQAAEAYRTAAETNPQDPAFWKLLAEFSLRRELQVTTLGLPAARNAASLAPDDAAAGAVLGYANHLSGGGLLGERLLQRSLSLDPARALTWYRYGLLLLDRARYTDARAALATATDLDPAGSVGRLAKLSMESLPGADS